MRRYHVENNDVTFDPDGDWVRYNDAQDAIQDERDKLERIQKVAQVAVDNWPQTTLFSALKTVLQICQDGKASPITEGQSSELW